MNNKEKALRTGQEERWFSVFLICFWITAFFSEGAYASYLTSLGYGEALIGRVMSSLGLASLFFMPAGGYIADRFSNYRVLTSVCVCIIASMIWLVCWKPTVTVVYLFTVIGIGASRVLEGFLDSWIGKISKEEKELDYGRIRSSGSIAYAVSAPVLGRLFARVGYITAGFTAVIMAVLSLVAAYKLRNPEFGEGEKKGPSLRRTVRYLLGNRRYMAFLICIMLMNVTAQSFYGFIGVLVENIGGDVENLGIYYFILAFLEFLVVRNYSKIIGKIGLKNTIVLSMVGTAIKSVAPTMVHSMAGFYCCAATQCISFALSMPSNPVFQARYVDKEYLSTGMLVTTTCSTGLISFLLSATYGRIAERIGVAYMLRWFSLFALAAAVLFWFIGPKDAGMAPSEKSDESTI